MSAPACKRCPHLLVVHGAGKCWGVGCDCPSDLFAWGLAEEPDGSEVHDG